MMTLPSWTNQLWKSPKLRTITMGVRSELLKLGNDDILGVGLLDGAALGVGKVQQWASLGLQGSY